MVCGYPGIRTPKILPRMKTPSLEKKKQMEKISEKKIKSKKERRGGRTAAVNPHSASLFQV